VGMSEPTDAPPAADTGTLMDPRKFELVLADTAHPEAGWRLLSFTRPAAVAPGARSGDSPRKAP
jgi:hypothetical protein